MLGFRCLVAGSLCPDTCVEIPAIVEMIEVMLARMKKFSQQQNLNIDVHLLKPPPEQSFWVNINRSRLSASESHVPLVHAADEN